MDKQELKVSIIAVVIFLILGFAYLTWRKSEAHDLMRNNPEEFDEEIFDYVYDNRDTYIYIFEDELTEAYNEGYSAGYKAGLDAAS